MSIKHLLYYIVRGTSSEALQKLLEMVSFNVKTERHTLQDILANILNRLLTISFGKGLDTLFERLNGICVFYINSSLYYSPEVDVQRVGLQAGQEFCVLLLMTRPRNFSFRNSKVAFVQCGGAPSCIHQSEERSSCRVAQLGPNYVI